MTEGRERAGGEFFPVPAHIFAMNTQRAKFAASRPPKKRKNRQLIVIES